MLGAKLPDDAVCSCAAELFAIAFSTKKSEIVATVIKIKKQFGLGNMLFCIHTKNTKSIQDTTEQK